MTNQGAKGQKKWEVRQEPCLPSAAFFSADQVTTAVCITVMENERAEFGNVQHSPCIRNSQTRWKKLSNQTAQSQIQKERSRSEMERKDSV